MNKITKTLSLAVAMFAIAGLMTGAFTSPAYATDEGCSSGHYKNDSSKRTEDDWIGTTGGGSFETELGTDLDNPIRVKETTGKPTNESDPTMLQALQAKGGGMNALVRELAAALLNARNGSIHYDLTEGEIQTLFANLDQSNAADVETLRAQLFAENHKGDAALCPL